MNPDELVSDPLDKKYNELYKRLVEEHTEYEYKHNIYLELIYYEMSKYNHPNRSIPQSLGLCINDCKSKSCLLQKSNIFTDMDKSCIDNLIDSINERVELEFGKGSSLDRIEVIIDHYEIHKILNRYEYDIYHRSWDQVNYEDN